MKCEIVQDLLPLYIDQCCSDASRTEVEMHLQSCSKCASLWKQLSKESCMDRSTDLNVKEVPQCRQVCIWKASVLQSVLFLISFLLIVIGVTKEAATGSRNSANGIWLFDLIVPATALMLTMVNWYFVRFYHSHKSFSGSCIVIFLFISLLAALWGLSHYHLWENLQQVMQNPTSYLPGVVLTIIFAVLSNRAADIYAGWIGKF